MILGTFHFDSTPDAFASPLKDVLAPRRQGEIEAMVQALGEFRPTKIAVEALPDDRRLVGFGEGRLGPNEIDQIAFRLARRLGHQRVYGVDYRLDANPMPVIEWAIENGQAETVGPLMAEFQAQVLPRLGAEHQRARTISQLLAEMNEPEQMRIEHRLLARLLGVGSSDNPLGADFLARTARRNTMIASHIRRLATPGERVFVLIGASHRLPLERILADGEDVVIVDPLPYIPKGQAKR
jgi:hypothetical protein